VDISTVDISYLSS